MATSKAIYIDLEPREVVYLKRVLAVHKAHDEAFMILCKIQDAERMNEGETIWTCPSGQTKAKPRT